MLKDIWRYFTTEVSYFRPCVETKTNSSERKVCIKSIQFRSWFSPGGAKFSSSIIQRFSRCFSLSFNVSVDFVLMFVPVEMFASWYCIGIFEIFFGVIEPNVKWCFWITNVWNVAATFTVDFMVDFKRFVGLSTFECCCRKKLLAAKRTYWFAWTHFPGWWFFFQFL